MTSNEAIRAFDHHFDDAGDDECCLVISRQNADGTLSIMASLYGQTARYVVGKMVAANRQAALSQQAVGEEEIVNALVNDVGVVTTLSVLQRGIAKPEQVLRSSARALLAQYNISKKE